MKVFELLSICGLYFTYQRRYMLRRCICQQYRYQEFEMSRMARLPNDYPREAPNTSYFGMLQLHLFMNFGWGREELWFDKEFRRYERSWELIRRMLTAMMLTMYVFPIGIPAMLYCKRYGPYGEAPYLCLLSKNAYDNYYIEAGGDTLDAEWIRHIHSKENH